MLIQSLLFACAGKRDTSSIRVLKIALAGNISQSPSTGTADDDRGEGAAAVDEPVAEEGADAGAGAGEGATAGADAGAEEGRAADDAGLVPPPPPLPPPPPPHPAKPTKAAPDRNPAKPRNLLFSAIRTSFSTKARIVRRRICSTNVTG
jgi:hypothetical protein